MYSQALYKLLTSAYIKPSTVLSHVSPRDKRIKYEAEEKAKISGFPTAKELREARETAQARLKREEEEAEKVGLVRWTLPDDHKCINLLVSQTRKVTQQPGHRSGKVWNCSLLLPISSDNFCSVKPRTRKLSMYVLFHSL